MNKLDGYLPIPISAAEQIANEFQKDQVIIVTWDKVYGMVHVTTFGKDKDDSIQAAQGGNFVKQALGWPDQLCHSVPKWYEDEKKALLDACKMALAEMQNTDRAIEAEAEAKGKHGIYSPWFTDEIQQLKTVIEQAEAKEKSNPQGS